MNYRHHFHAGNFADLVKHAALCAVLDRLLTDPAPLLVIDTHAGAGGYDLPAAYVAAGEGAAARRLCADEAAPAVFAPLKAAIRPGPTGSLVYPGSPALIADRLRPRDAFVACELREDDHRALAARLGDLAEVLREDGYDVAAARLSRRAGRALVLVDPHYERADDYERVLQLLGQAPGAAFLVWLPLKDLESFDRFLRGVEALPVTDALVGEVRLRPLSDPMRLNGCAVLLVRTPDVAEPLGDACAWVAEALGGPGGGGRAWRL